MSSIEADSSTSDAEQSITESSNHSGTIPDHERSLAQRLILHVYNTFGLTDARQLPFWESFRLQNPDVELSAAELRDMFFYDVLNEPEHLEDLPYAVVQYLNPRFNQFEAGVLEAGDIIEQEDFVFNVPQTDVLLPDGGMTFQQMASYISAPMPVTLNMPLVPLNLQLSSGPPRSTVTAGEDGLSTQVAELFRELLRIQDGPRDSTRPFAEIREHVRSLNRRGVVLLDLLDSSMRASQVLCELSAPSQSETDPPVNASSAAHQEDDQIVPIGVAAAAASPVQVKPGSDARRHAKRWTSWDDSGLGMTPYKRSRLLTPSTRKHPRLRRILSEPNTPFR